jgi:hypothetical protein
VIAAVVVGLLTALAMGAGVLASPPTVGTQLTGSKGKAYVVIGTVFAATSGAIIGLGVYATHGSNDWTPLFIALGVVGAGFVAVVLVLVVILRGLMREQGSALMRDGANGGPQSAQAAAGSWPASGREPWAHHPARQTPGKQRPLRGYVAYAAYTAGVTIACGLGSVAGAITEILIRRNDLAATGVAFVVVVVALVPLLRIARFVARGLMTDRG